MKVSTIICTKGRKSLESCLESLEEQSIDSEKIVVSHKNIESRLKEYNDVNFIKTKKQSLSEDRNKGIIESKGDIIVFLDDDAIAKKGWLETLVKHYKNDKVAAVGGAIKPDFRSEVPSSIRELDKHIRYGLIGCTFVDWDDAGEINSPLLWGCNISFRRSIFEEIGYFPPELGRRPGMLLGEEERYLQLEILNRGYKMIFEPDSVVKHIIEEEQLTENHFIEKSFWQGVSEIKRLKLSNNLEGLSKNRENIIRISEYKLAKKKFQLKGLNSLKEKIDLSRDIGRLTELIKTFKGS